MNKKAFLACFCAVFAAYMFLPCELSAKDVISAESAGELKEMTKGIQRFIFGMPVNLMCIFGAGMGFYQMIAQNSVTPLLTWGGISIMVKFIPVFLDAMFG